MRHQFCIRQFRNWFLDRQNPFEDVLKRVFNGTSSGIWNPDLTCVGDVKPFAFGFAFSTYPDRTGNGVATLERYDTSKLATLYYDPLR